MTVPFVPLANGVEAVLQFLYFGQTVLNVFNFLFPAAPAESDRTALNTALHTFWTNQLKPTLSGNLQLNQIRSSNLAFAGAPQTTLVIGTPEGGTVAGESLPGNASYVVTHRTALRGRNYRGRTYLSGIPVSKMVASSFNSMTATSISNILTAMAWLMTPANVAGSEWVVLSRRSNNAWRGAGLATPVTAVSGDLYVDSQRRRLTGRGF